MKVEERLRKARVQAGFTQKQMAEKLHIYKDTYRSYEAGYSMIQSRHIKKLCETLDISADWLFDVKLANKGE